MVQPAAFGPNPVTTDNVFQNYSVDRGYLPRIQEKALREFNMMAASLQREGVEVVIMDDTPEPPKTDAVFPNNWITTHEDGSVIIYPMMAMNRRSERTMGIIEKISDLYHVRELIDLTHFEYENKFLEGTGSMVLDRVNKQVFSSISYRTSSEVLQVFSSKSGYRVISFHAVDQENRPVYHTNVMMSVTEKQVIVCLDAVRAEEEKQELLAAIHKSGRELLEISYDQIRRFCGNVLEVRNAQNENLLVMSDSAYEGFNDDQIASIEKYDRIIHTPLTTIETYGGGSARCMIAEIFLPNQGE